MWGAGGLHAGAEGACAELLHGECSRAGADARWSVVTRASGGARLRAGRPMRVCVRVCVCARVCVNTRGAGGRVCWIWIDALMDAHLVASQPHSGVCASNPSA